MDTTPIELMNESVFPLLLFSEADRLGMIDHQEYEDFIRAQLIGIEKISGIRVMKRKD